VRPERERLNFVQPITVPRSLDQLDRVALGQRCQGLGAVGLATGAALAGGGSAG
jgi:hypothetical protein